MLPPKFEIKKILQYNIYIWNKGDVFMFPVVVKINYLNNQEEVETKYYAVYSKSLAAAVDTIEEYWGDSSIKSICAEVVDTEDVLFELPEHIAAQYIRDGCFLF